MLSYLESCPLANTRAEQTRAELQCRRVVYPHHPSHLSRERERGRGGERENQGRKRERWGEREKTRGERERERASGWVGREREGWREIAVFSESLSLPGK